MNETQQGKGEVASHARCHFWECEPPRSMQPWKCACQSCHMYNFQHLFPFAMLSKSQDAGIKVIPGSGAANPSPPNAVPLHLQASVGKKAKPFPVLGCSRQCRVQSDEERNKCSHQEVYESVHQDLLRKQELQHHRVPKNAERLQWEELELKHHGCTCS